MVIIDRQAVENILITVIVIVVGDRGRTNDFIVRDMSNLSEIHI